MKMQLSRHPCFLLASPLYTIQVNAKTKCKSEMPVMGALKNMYYHPGPDLMGRQKIQCFAFTACFEGTLG